jgi:hypothetical protein
MSKIFRVIDSLVFSMVLMPVLFSQEVVVPMYDNPAAARTHAEQEGLKKGAPAASLTLPLFDDFSTTYAIPDQDIWSDKTAFVNNNFAVDPVTNGVATLDALDADGSIYAHAVKDPNTFVADYLTSQSVSLEYPASDSIYLSFLYQPAGLCDPPEEQDSLMVDFFAPDSAAWINVWRVPGTGSLYPFRQVMIPIIDTQFLKDGFRFRFRNRASLSRNNDYPDMRNNVDYWHVDYVRLDRNRYAADTVLRDVAFITPLSPVLKDLTSLPWSHFEAAYNTVLDMYASARYRNNDTISRNVTRSLSIIEPYYNEIHTPVDPTAQDLPALQDTVVNFGYIFPLDFNRGDSALLRFKASLRTDEFDPKVNDTVVHDQYFKDYYSYDDGTPEAGYGLRGGGTRDGMVALKYHAYEADELGGVYMLFNHVYDSLNLGYYFRLLVWDDLDGRPGSVIWEDEEDHTPAYSSNYPGFTRYNFSQPVPVDGTFYVGWRQYNEYLLNVGLDLNNRPSSVMFYNFQGQWESSEAPGVIMCRPFLYREPTHIGNPGEEASILHIYPNPARDRIYVIWPEPMNTDEVRLEMFDASGRMVVLFRTRSDSYDVSALLPGIYYIRALAGQTIYRSKLVINP